MTNTTIDYTLLEDQNYLDTILSNLRLVFERDYDNFKNEMPKLKEGLSSGNKKILEFVLYAILFHSDKSDIIDVLAEFDMLVDILTSVNVTTRYNGDVLMLLARNEVGLAFLMSDTAASIFTELRKDDVGEFRVLEFFSRFSVISQRHFELARDKLWIMTILQVSDQVEDILGLMNVMQLIEILCESSHVLEYLIENDVASLFEEMLDSGFDVLEIRAIETLGNISEKCLEKAFNAFVNTEFLNFLFNFFDNFQYREQIITCLYQMSLTEDGLNHISNIPKARECLIGYFQTERKELQICTIHCLSGLIEKYPYGDELAKQLYLSAGTDYSTTEILLTLFQDPMQDVQLSAYSLAFALSKRDWGITTLCSVPGVVEYLLNRTLDSSKAALEWKHLIIKTICLNPNAHSLLDRTTFHEFNDYLTLGVFFTEHAQTATLIKDSFL